jgi:hypothetical protein
LHAEDDECHESGVAEPEQQARDRYRDQELSEQVDVEVVLRRGQGEQPVLDRGLDVELEVEVGIRQEVDEVLAVHLDP